MLGNIFILGDSYSTFEGYIPQGFAPYYRKDGPWYLKSDPNCKPSSDDVVDVKHTWWYDLVNENGKLIRNCSFSGTTICNTGYKGDDYSKISFIARMEKLISKGFFKQNKIDTFFLFGGTNDSASGAPLGEKMYSDWTKADLYNVFPAFTYLVNLIKTNFPDAKVYCIINNCMKEEIVEFYGSVCKANDIGVILLHDIDKINSHPTIKGMLEIKKQVLEYITSNQK